MIPALATGSKMSSSPLQTVSPLIFCPRSFINTQLLNFLSLRCIFAQMLHQTHENIQPLMDDFLLLCIKVESKSSWLANQFNCKNS